MDTTKCESNYVNTNRRCVSDSSLLVSVYRYNPTLQVEIFSKDVKCCGKHVRSVCVREINEGKTIRLFKRTKEGDFEFYEPYGLENVKNLPPQPVRPINNVMVAPQPAVVVQPTVHVVPPPPPPPVVAEVPVPPIVLPDVLMSGKHACSICFDDTDDVFCTSHRHVMCNECFSGHVLAESNHIDFNGTVKCPLHRLNQCDCRGFSVSFIAKHASEEAFTEFDRKRYAIKEKSLVTKIEADLKKKLTLQNNETAVEKDLRHVRENILTLKCPKCFYAYSPSFDGCLSLRCPNNCGQFFCAKCHLQCKDSKSCHNHVAVCRLNKSPAGLFHSAAVIQNIQNEMRKQKLIYFLSTKPHKKELLNALRKDFLDLGLKHNF